MAMIFTDKNVIEKEGYMPPSQKSLCLYMNDLITRLTVFPLVRYGVPPIITY